MDAEAVAGELRAIVVRAIEAPDCPSAVRRRLGELAEPDAAGRLTRFCLDELARAGAAPAGRRCLDVGAGTGAFCVVMALAGAREVHGVEIGRSGVEGLRWLAAREPALAAITAHLADATALPLPDGSVDVVWSNETIGVFLDLEAVLVETARVSAPGATIVLTEANDHLNPRVRARSRRLAVAYEQGPAGVHDGHEIGVTYEQRRAERVRELAPDLDEATVAAIARGTAQRTWPQVEAAVAEHARTGALPGSTFDPARPAVDPDGAHVEAIVDPARIRAVLEPRGFRVATRGRWGGAGGSTAVRTADRVLRALGPLAVRTAPNAVHVARRAR